MSVITLPANYRPRPYQQPFWDYMEGGGKRYFGVWHRRGGKDHTMLAWTTKAAFQRVGLYWHIYPTYEMGYKNLWNAASRDGVRFMDGFPDEVVKRRTEQRMMTELVNGSIHQIVGADDPDRLRGPNPVGIVMSEFSLHHPDAWNVLSPILAENGGWACFNMTPAGRNHAYQMLQHVQKLANWKTEILTVDETTLDDGSRVVSQEAIDEERSTGKSEGWIQQEYYCSFEAPYSGAIYADLLLDLRAKGRVGDFPYNPDFPVFTWWDIGINDETAIWYIQQIGDERRFIACDVKSGWPLDRWIKHVLEKPYIYSHHVGPWDLAHREQSTGHERLEFALRHGIRFEVASRSTNLADDIHEVRRYMTRYKCTFDARNTALGLDAMGQYHWRLDAQGRPTEKPHHDFSHAPDAIRHGVTYGYDQRGDTDNYRSSRDRPQTSGRYDVTRPHLVSSGRDGYQQQRGIYMPRGR